MKLLIHSQTSSVEPLKFGYWAQDKTVNDDIRPVHDWSNDETLQLCNTIHKNYQSKRMTPARNCGRENVSNRPGVYFVDWLATPTIHLSYR